MKKILFQAFLIYLLAAPATSLGFVIVKNITAPATGGFSLSPGKLEFQINEGERVTRELRVLNGSGATSEFKITFGEMAGIKQSGSLGIDKYISVDNDKFILESGEEAIVTVTANIPDRNSSKFAGGTILVSRKIVGAPEGSQIASRIGSLVFVDIGKTAVRSGYLSDFKYTENKGFEIVFKNTGEAHLNPYGFIEIRNIFGDFSERKIIEPWYVLPGTERTREIIWDFPSKLSPLYKAQLVLYPGYGVPENTENVSIIVYNFYAIFAYIILFLFLIIIVIKYLKNAKK